MFNSQEVHRKFHTMYKRTKNCLLFNQKKRTCHERRENSAQMDIYDDELLDRLPNEAKSNRIRPSYSHFMPT